MSKSKYFLCTLGFVSFTSFADTVQVAGKIVATQGHYTPACRMVKLKETPTSPIRVFRIADVPGHDDINSVALAALVANRDVSITYDPAVTTGCGGEPKILYIEIW